MNAAVNHIMQTVDWTRFSLEEWLYQFGAWMHSNSGTCGKSINPIAVAMDQAVKKRKQQIKGKDQIIADWISSEGVTTVKRKGITCDITDNEARAVQRLILDMQGKSHVLDEWLDAVIDRYFYGNPISALVNESRTLMDAKFDLKMGLAAIHARYPFIEYKSKVSQ
ncbi:hypothetical protein [Acinetobacter junii]|uniref:hypothetical protein n=1 Tax=Acinetobacter junii TaxID=40215 RepID=UPI00124C0DC8|nr:hypothetical protein [Acinetobacter junii]